jgi:hypothetical protein
MKAEVDAVDGMRQVTMYLRIKRGTELRWRLWLGTRLIALAALVMNCNIEVDEL